MTNICVTSWKSIDMDMFVAESSSICIFHIVFLSKSQSEKMKMKSLMHRGNPKKTCIGFLQFVPHTKLVKRVLEIS